MKNVNKLKTLAESESISKYSRALPVCLSVCLSDCRSHTSRTVHLVDTQHVYRSRPEEVQCRIFLFGHPICSVLINHHHSEATEVWLTIMTTGRFTTMSQSSGLRFWVLSFSEQLFVQQRPPGSSDSLPQLVFTYRDSGTAGHFYSFRKKAATSITTGQTNSPSQTDVQNGRCTKLQREQIKSFLT